MPPDRPSAEAERVRIATDAGLFGDKVPASDPAAAPLGTDSEAAGRPIPADTVMPPRPEPAAPRPPPGRQAGPSPSSRTGILVALVAFAVTFILFLAGLGLVITNN